MQQMMDATLAERVGSDKLLRVAEMLKVASHPQRLAILDYLGAHHRVCVRELENVLGIEQANLSQHLTLMRDKGLLTVERVGKFSYYQVAQPSFLRVIKDLERCCEQL